MTKVKSYHIVSIRGLSGDVVLAMRRGVQRSLRKKNFLTLVAGSLALVGPLLLVGVISSQGHLPCSLTVRYPHSRGGVIVTTAGRGAGCWAVLLMGR